MASFLQHPRGFRLFFRHWAHEAPRAVIILAHGMGEHTGRYEPLAQFFNSRSLAVMGADFPGFGQSSGKRGYAPGMDAFYETLDLVWQQSRQSYPDKPVFILGQSMGGNIALNYCLRQPAGISGVIAASPWIRLRKMPPALMVALARLMRKIYPAFTQSNGLDPADFSRDPEVVRVYREDPWVHDKVAAGIGFELLEAGLFLDAYAGSFETPLLLTHGTADALTDPQATEAFSKRVKGPVTLRLWEGLYHETHFEPEKQQVLEWIANWIDQQIN